MAKRSSYGTLNKRSAVSHYGTGKANDEGGKFVDRKLGAINPKNQQFEPTSTEPVRQRFKMGGGC